MDLGFCVENKKNPNTTYLGVEKGKILHFKINPFGNKAPSGAKYLTLWYYILLFGISFCCYVWFLRYIITQDKNNLFQYDFNE